MRNYGKSSRFSFCATIGSYPNDTLIMNRFLLLATAAIISILSTGCSTIANRPKMDTPTSSASYNDAIERGRALVKVDRNLSMLQVSDTGSMAPFLGETSILVMEPVKAADVLGGNIISYQGENGETKVHQVIRVAEAGVITHGKSVWWTEFVPFERITGRCTAVFYFDKSTLSSPYAGKLPVGYANEAAPFAAGLHILKAKMLSAGTPVKISYAGPGRYNMTLPHGATLRLHVGAKGANWENASSVDVGWADEFAGRTRKVSLFDEANPGLGNILLSVNYDN